MVHMLAIEMPMKVPYNGNLSYDYDGQFKCGLLFSEKREWVKHLTSKQQYWCSASIFVPSDAKAQNSNL